jgi:hypothetical protein
MPQRARVFCNFYIRVDREALVSERALDVGSVVFKATSTKNKYCHCVKFLVQSTVCPRIEFTRGKKFLFLILRKNFRGITFFASSETPISVIKISVLIHCILKLTFFVQIWTLN